MFRLFRVVVVVVVALILVPITVFAKSSESRTTVGKIEGDWVLQKYYIKSSDGSPIAIKSVDFMISIRQTTGSNFNIQFLGIDSIMSKYKCTINVNTVNILHSGQDGFVEKLTGTLSSDKRTITGKLDVDWGKPGNNGKPLHHFGTWKATKSSGTNNLS